jgi:hypothetical protein
MRYRILLLSIVVACGGKPSTAPSPISNREVRLLDADDVALRPVVFAAAKHIFDPNASQVLAFGGVYVNKRELPSLSSDVRSFITRNGGFRPASRPGECDAPTTDRPAAPKPPTTTGSTGGAPNPTSQPTRTTSNALCNRGAEIVYSFTAVRIASDTAYLEMAINSIATTTKCLSLKVDKEAGGWIPGETKASKIGQCGK